MSGKQLTTLLYLVVALSGCDQGPDSMETKAARYESVNPF